MFHQNIRLKKRAINSFFQSFADDDRNTILINRIENNRSRMSFEKNSSSDEIF